MKIQLAIDRVTIEEAFNIIDDVEYYVDYIEIGTSLFLDYGQNPLKKIREKCNHKLVADIKTVDEAQYEFERVFNNGADIATVLGTANESTLEICQTVSQQMGKSFMIDTIGISKEDMKKIERLHDAILCFHKPKDEQKSIQQFLDEVNQLLNNYNLTNRIAVAGGISLEDAHELKSNELVDIIIVGSYITESDDRKSAAKQLREMINYG